MSNDRNDDGVAGPAGARPAKEGLNEQPQERRSQPVGDLVAFITREHDWTAWIVKAAGAGPLLTILASVGPPEPDWNFVAIGTVVCQLLVYVAMYLLAIRCREQALYYVTWSILPVTVLLLVTYLNLFLTLTAPAPDHQHRVVIGAELLPKIAAHQQATGGPTTASELLEQNSRDAALIWTPDSIASARIQLLLAWGALTVSCMALMSLAVLVRIPPDPTKGA